LSEVTGYQLTVVGEGYCQSTLEQMAQGMPVRFAGFQADPSRFYREADLFINPSLGPEGLPLVSLEAMSYGLACIFSDLPVHKEIAKEGEYAVLFQCGKAADLRAKLEMFMTSPELLVRYGVLGRANAEHRYGPDAARANYQEVLAS
jgi:glycosyltransferase involved in cell wall biosynthesis